MNSKHRRWTRRNMSLALKAQQGFVVSTWLERKYRTRDRFDTPPFGSLGPS